MLTFFLCNLLGGPLHGGTFFQQPLAPRSRDFPLGNALRTLSCAGGRPACTKSSLNLLTVLVSTSALEVARQAQCRVLTRFGRWLGGRKSIEFVEGGGEGVRLARARMLVNTGAQAGNGLTRRRGAFSSCLHNWEQCTAPWAPVSSAGTCNTRNSVWQVW